MPAPRREAKYEAIAADLAARVASGEYRPGHPLPSQRTLSQTYGVTLMTLRQALRMLADQGLIVLRAGKDTLVAPPPATYRLDSLRSLTDDLREQGHEVDTEVIGAAVRRPPQWAAAWLGPDRALRLERVRAVGGRAAAHQVSWVREPHASAVRGRDFRQESLYHALADIGVLIHRATETIRPSLLTAAMAATLGQSPGGAVLVSERITYAVDGTAVVADRASIVGSLMGIRAERSASQVSLRWGQLDGAAPGSRPSDVD
jgi:GntR family transcriptional regulator